MLDDVLAAYLDGLERERDFDAAFFALLRARGFYDLHFLHGSYEFGKDFIAKRDEAGTIVQYRFQSKLGDVTLGEWRREVQPQCEEMLFTSIGHPQMDNGLPQRAVLVLTGVLRGQAQVSSQQYSDGLAARQLPPLEFWDRETLVDHLTEPACLGRTDWYYLGEVIASVRSGSMDLWELGRWTKRWLKMGKRQTSTPADGR